MLMILVLFIVFSMVAALFNSRVQRQQMNQPDVKNTPFDVDALHNNRYEIVKITPAMGNKKHLNTNMTVHEQLGPDIPTSQPSEKFLAERKAENISGTKRKKPAELQAKNTPGQRVSNTEPAPSIVIKFNDRELERIRAGRIHRPTGKRILVKKYKHNYIRAVNGQLFDARKIIKVVQKKLAHKNSQNKSNDSMALKLQLLQMGINALKAQHELPNNFELAEDCIVDRTVKYVRYGELKQMANFAKPLITSSLEHPGDISSSTRPKITALRINYKLKKPQPMKHKIQ